MRIRSKVELNLFLIAAVLSLVAALLSWTVLDFRDLRLVQQNVHAIKSQVAATNVLAMEYVLRPTERIIQQWQNVQNQLTKVVRSLKSENVYNEAATEITELNQKVAIEFSQLHQIDTPIDSEAFQVRFHLLLGDIQAMLSLTDQLVAELDARYGEGQVRLNGAIAAAVVMLILSTLLTYLAIIPSIFRPMSSLLDGIRAFGRGELVELKENQASNEFGEIACAFAEMQDRLVTSRTELESAVDHTRRVNQELLRSNRELDDFAYIASHDLKEPLRAACNHANFLLEDYREKLGENGKRRLRRLIELNQRMEELIADLLYFSRLGRGDDATEVLDLHAVIDGIKTDLAETLRERSVTVTVSGTLPTIEGHRPHITALFRNLINNGIKYNDADEKIIEIGHTSDAPKCTSGAYDTFYVKDNGIGIESEFKDEIFRIFKRLNSETAYGEGTGAGLSFAKKIVESHGGRIWLDSEPGYGTTFFLTLRRSNEGGDAAPAGLRAHPKSSH